MMLLLLAVPALQRAGSFSSGTFDARDFSLHMVFPRDYSAFGLATEQMPARRFITISVMLRLGGLLSYLPLFVDADAYGFTTYLSAALSEQGSEQLQLFRDQQAEQVRRLQYKENAQSVDSYRDINSALVQAFGVAYFAFLCISGCGCCFLSQGFCVGNDFSGAAAADLALQERIDDRARILAARMREGDLKPTWKEYVRLHADMLLFAWDFVSDGLALWQFFELELFWLFAFQLVIILTTLWEESRVVRKLGIRAAYRAVAESSSHGWATDNLMAIMMQEKLIQAPPSSILFEFASLHLPESAGRHLLGIDFMFLFSRFKMFTSSFSSAWAAYVLMHLDLDRHIVVAVEGLGLPSARGGEKSSGMPVQPSQAHGPGHKPPAQLVGPAVLMDPPAFPPRKITPRHVAPAPAFPPEIAPCPATPPQSAPCLQGGGLKHMPAQESPVQDPAASSCIHKSKAFHASQPPIQVGAPRGAADQE